MSAQHPDHTILTEGQRRHLTASLSRVADALREIELLAQACSHHDGAAPGVRCDLPGSLAEVLPEHVVRARVLLLDLMGRFDLRPPERSARRSVQALVISSLVLLEDAGSRSLRGYGNVDRKLPDLLDPSLRQLQEVIGDMASALMNATPGEGADESN